MIEFFQSIGSWLVYHKDTILLTVMSTEFAGLVAAICGIFKSRKVTSSNTLANKALSENITELSDANTEVVNATTEAVKTIKSMTTEVTALKEELSILKKELDVTKEQNSIITSKLDAILEVQSIVYSTIKDSQTRTTVANILTNAKHTVLNQTVKIKEEVQSLKDKLNEKVKEIQDFATQASDHVDAIISPIADKTSVSRC